MHDGGGFSGGHHGGGFGGHHHHDGGFAGHHHHQDQGDPSGFFLSSGNVRPRANSPRPSAARYLGFAVFLVVILAVLLIVAH